MRRGLAYAALGVVLLLAPACQSEPEPRFGPPESPSPSSTPPEPTPSDQPEALTPEQTVRAWVEARNAALQDGDIRAMTALHSTDCRGCAEFSDAIDGVYDSGGSYDTKGWTVRGADLKSINSGRATVLADVKTARGTTIANKGAIPTSYPASDERLRFELTKEGGRWLIDYIVYL